MSSQLNKQQAGQRIMAGSMWADFCDRLKAAGSILERPETPADPFNRMLGYRYLTRLLRCGLESNIDYADPQFPAFFRIADETKKIGNDNPDNYYLNCVIDGRFDYKITGTRGTVTWFSIATKGGTFDAEGGMAADGEIHSQSLELAADGSFEIIVSNKEHKGNWLPVRKDSQFMVVRQTFGDRSKEDIAEMKIECLNPERQYNNPNVESFEASLQKTINFVESTSNLFIDWMEIYRREHLNSLPEDNQERCQAAGGDATIHYYQSYWKLAPDEALLVHMHDFPPCQTWNLQLSNYWCESMDYRYFPASVNKHTAKYEGDGSVKIVIAHQNPGPDFPNWLDTCQHDQGGMLGRFIHCDNPPGEMPATVVKFADLAGATV